jgi:hypothetical protein
VDLAAGRSVGYDGEAYVENLGRHNKLEVERPDGRYCVAAFDYAPVLGRVPTIGPLACRDRKP